MGGKREKHEYSLFLVNGVRRDAVLSGSETQDFLHHPLLCLQGFYIHRES